MTLECFAYCDYGPELKTTRVLFRGGRETYSNSIRGFLRSFSITLERGRPAVSSECRIISFALESIWVAFPRRWLSEEKAKGIDARGDSVGKK